MSRIAAVCFDAFGTLISYGGKRTSPYRHLIKPGGRQQARRLPFLTRDAGVAVFAEELGLLHLLPIIQRELEEEIAALRLFTEVETVLRELQAKGMQIAVCSNLTAEYGPAVRALLPAVDAHVLSFEVGAAKPEPAIYAAVCSALGRAAHEVFFVGDSKRCDLHGPSAFGMHARWLDRRNGSTLVEALEEIL